MDPFGPALHGTMDVADSFANYLRERATASAADRGLERALDTEQDLQERQTWVRETLLDRIGGLPERPESRNVTTTGSVRREGVTVECLTFQSLTNYTVTANCYVPDGEGPHPGILFQCGHLDDPRQDDLNQRACLDLARNGFVVLIFDPVSQGERRQYADLERDDGTVSGGGGTFQHAYAGQKCFYAGGNLARYSIHDARCALDVLAAREDVDGSRIASIGTSGGGTQSIYLGGLDDRLSAIAPCCSMSTREEQFRTGNRTHAEEAITGSITDGLTYADLLAAVAPRPVCIGAGASDHWFPIEGVHEMVARVQPVYDRLDASDSFALHVGDSGHCSVYELRNGIFPWLCDTLDAGTYEPATGLDPLDESAVQCTETGSVLTANADERTIDDLISDFVTETVPAPDSAGILPDDETAAGTGGSDGAGDDTGYDESALTAFKATVRDTLGVPDIDTTRHPRVAHESTEDGLDIEYVWFCTERDPDAFVAAVLASDPDATPESPAVALYTDGTRELPDRTEDVQALAREHGAVLVFDPRGVGAIRNRVIPVPAWADHYHGMFGTEFKLANDALLLDTSLLGLRVADILEGIDFLANRFDAETVSLVGYGMGVYRALYAAVLSDQVDAVTIRDLGPSFADRATTHDVPYDPELTVYDVIGRCDIPHVFSALEQQGVLVDGAPEY